MATRYGEESGQLAQTQHDGDAGGRDDHVTEQKTQRATSSKGFGGTQEETSTDDTTDTTMADQYDGGGRCGRGDSRDHLGMTVLQPTMELAVRTNLILLDDVLVGGFFLVFFGHPCWSCKTGGCSTKV